MWKVVAVLALGFGAYLLLLAIRNPSYTPPPPPVAKMLMPDAASRCADAFIGAPATGTPGSTRGLAAALISHAGSGWGPYYGGHVLPSRIEAKSPGDVQALVCVRDTRIQVGIYQPGNIKALRMNWDVRVLRWPSGQVIAGGTFQGSDPPSTVSRKNYQQYETETGGYPHGAYTWLDGLFAR